MPDAVVVSDREDDVGLEGLDQVVEGLLAVLVGRVEVDRAALEAPNREDLEVQVPVRALPQVIPPMLDHLESSSSLDRLENSPHDACKARRERCRV